MISAVISIYFMPWLPAALTRKPSFAHTPAMSMADMNWLLLLISTVISPSGADVPRILNGKQFSFSKNSNRAPAFSSAEMRSPIGRLFICSDDRTTNSPSEKARRAVIKRAAVPALPTYTSPPFTGRTPQQPSTVTAEPFKEIFMPRLLRQSIKVRLSSERPAPYSVDVPFASAEINSARAVMLFEPGTDTSAFLFFIFL